MYTWLGISLAWLLGTALQLMSQSPARAWCGLGLALGASGLLAGAAGRWCLSQRDAVQGFLVEPDVAWRRSATCHALAALGLVCLAWGLTGWRALEKLEQRWPSDLSSEVVLADVRWVGLPKHVPVQASSSVAGRGGSARFRSEAGEVLGTASDSLSPERRNLVRWQVEARILRWHEPLAPPPGAKWPERVQLFWERPAAQDPPRPGQPWRVTMRLRKPDDRVNPGVGDGSLGRFSRGVRAVGRVVSAQALPAQSQSAPGWLESRLDAMDGWRQRVRDRILARVPDARAAGVLAGLSVGDQAAISRWGQTLKSATETKSLRTDVFVQRVCDRRPFTAPTQSLRTERNLLSEKRKFVRHGRAPFSLPASSVVASPSGSAHAVVSASAKTRSSDNKSETETPLEH